MAPAARHERGAVRTALLWRGKGPARKKRAVKQRFDGRRWRDLCTHPDCKTTAVDGYDVCMKHGGGKRCTHSDCKNKARPGYDVCATHGGGKRCTHPDCKHIARSGYDVCTTHGGGKRCTHPDCKHSAICGYDVCATHGGGKRCPCGKLFYHCGTCRSLEWALASGKFCVMGCGTELSKTRRRMGITTCKTCDPNEPPSPESYCLDQLAQLYSNVNGGATLHPPSARDNVLLNSCDAHDDAHRRRPDSTWVGADRVVHVEVDEDSHGDREVSCEEAKNHETHFGIEGDLKPTLMLRFNPHTHGQTRVLADDLENRLCVLARELHTALTAPLADLSLDALRTNVRYLFYGPEGQKHIDAARVQPQTNVLA